MNWLTARGYGRPHLTVVEVWSVLLLGQVRRSICCASSLLPSRTTRPHVVKCVSYQTYTERDVRRVHALLAWAIGVFLGLYASIEIGREVDSSWREMAISGFISGLALNGARIVLNKILRRFLKPIY